MKLKNGKTYVDGWGKSHKVMGPTRDYPEWVWTLGGFWFERETGLKVMYHPDEGHYVMTAGSKWDLKEAA